MEWRPASYWFPYRGDITAKTIWKLWIRVQSDPKQLEVDSLLIQEPWTHKLASQITTGTTSVSLCYLIRGEKCVCIGRQVSLPPQRKMELICLIPRRPPTLMLLPSCGFHSSVAAVTLRTVRKKDCFSKGGWFGSHWVPRSWRLLFGPHSPKA